MRSYFSIIFMLSFLLAGITGASALSSNIPLGFFSYFPSSYGISGSYGVGYGFGQGANLAKDGLLETGADSAKVIGSDQWKVDLFALWPIAGRFGVGFMFSSGPLSYAVIGYDAMGKAREGLNYSFFNLDVSALVSYRRAIQKGIISAMIGPLLGFRLGDGTITSKSEGLTNTSTVPGKQMLNASVGCVLNTVYSLSVGSGYIDMGMKISYHYSSAQGFLAVDSTPVNIITPSFSVGYSMGGKTK